MKKMIFACMFLMLLTSCSKNKTALYVNDEAVSTSEFSLAMDENVAKTYSYFKEKYNIDDSNTFWTDKNNEITPLQYVKELSLSAIIEKKIKMQLMKEYNILEDTSYERFLSDLEKENKLRKEAVSKGGVIYGPVTYGVVEYDIYLMSNREIKLKEQLSDAVFAYSEEELKAQYERTKEKDFKFQDTITIDAEGEILEFTHQLSRHDSQTYPEIHEMALTMKAGEVKVVELSDGGKVTVKCLSREEKGYLSYDEAKDKLRQDMIDKQYNDLIKSKVSRAKVVKNDKVYEKIKVRGR